MIDVDTLDPKPLGFGLCRSCAYRDWGGTAEICYSCASQRMEALAANRCPICEHEVPESGECGNAVCGYPEADRGFSFVWAIAMMSGHLQKAIWKYKLDGQRGWASIFGRVLAGYLDENASDFAHFDLITPSPTYVGTGGREWDHVGEIVQHAAEETDTEWPWDLEPPRAVNQTVPTPSFREQPTWQARRALAEGRFRASLEVPDPHRVAGKSVLLFDDVFTEGLRTREVARILRLAGADEVSQVVLARQPFRPR